MISDTSETSFPTSTSTGSAGLNGDGTVHRVAQKAHHAVDKLEQTIGSGSEKVMGWQQEYGEVFRERVKQSPLASVATAFAVGIVFSKLFMR